MKLHFCDKYNFTAKIQIKFKKNNTMATKKEILDCVKSIAEHQDLIATKQNTERKAEALTTQKLLAEILRELGQMRPALWEIRDTLFQIKNILEDAAKEPEPVMKESTLFEDVPKKEDVPEVKLPFDGVGEWIPLQEAKRRLKPKTHRKVDEFCEVYGTIFRRVGNHRPEVFWNDALCDVQPREQKVRKKEERKRQKPPQEGMKQLQTWAKHYGIALRDFNLGRKVCGIPKRESERDKRPQYAWLTPEEAEEINRLLTGITR